MDVDEGPTESSESEKSTIALAEGDDSRVESEPMEVENKELPSQLPIDEEPADRSSMSAPSNMETDEAVSSSIIASTSEDISELTKADADVEELKVKAPAGAEKSIDGSIVDDTERSFIEVNIDSEKSAAFASEIDGEVTDEVDANHKKGTVETEQSEVDADIKAKEKTDEKEKCTVEVEQSIAKVEKSATEIEKSAMEVGKTITEVERTITEVEKTTTEIEKSAVEADSATKDSENAEKSQLEAEESDVEIIEEDAKVTESNAGKVQSNTDKNMSDNAAESDVEIIEPDTSDSNAGKAEMNTAKSVSGIADAAKIGTDSTNNSSESKEPLSVKQSTCDQSTQDVEVMEVVESESKENGKSAAKSGVSTLDKIEATAKDSTVFVNADKVGSNTVQESFDKDPIGSDSAPNLEVQQKAIEVMDTDECILPDTGKINEGKDSTDSQDKEPETSEYIVTNSTEKTSFICMQCNQSSVPKYACAFTDTSLHICTEKCLNDLKEKKPGKVIVRGLRVRMFAAEALSRSSPVEVSRPVPTVISADAASLASDDSTLVCKECNKVISNKNYFSWNTFNYCNDTCLAIYQKITGVKCVQCNTDVPESLIGKYGVRFGKDMMQFCKNSCLLDHKKGQKFCSLCQAQLDLEGSCNGFCSVKCFEVHGSMKKQKTGLCSVCLKEKPLEIEYKHDPKTNMFCSDPCFVAYKFVNNVQPSQCDFCKVYRPKQGLTFSFSFAGILHNLCSKDCQKLFIITNRKIVHCLWCNVKKYNFDMVQVIQSNTHFVVCSLNCYNLYQISLQAMNPMQTRGCDLCHKDLKPLFHVTTIDGKVHNFCSPHCLNLYKDSVPENTINSMTATEPQVNGTAASPQTKREVKKYVVVKPRPIPKQRNIATMCKPYQITKSVNCKPRETTKSCQTEEFSNKFFLPVPVPIYIPAPMQMYAQPVPMPLPFPLPVPVPIFIPTTRKSAAGILKEINKIKNKVPADPLEAEVLMMAEMVAGDKKDDSDSESEEEAAAAPASSEPLDANSSFGEDVLQMALKMASDFEGPVDLEGSVSATTIASQAGQEDSTQRIESIMETKRRNIRQARQGRRKQQQPQQQQQTEVFNPPAADSSATEKPDANMCLKYTFGVNAWKQWVTTKNIELQKTSKRVKLFKTEILQLTADELNFSLCLFVKEVRKPNGAEYAPDTIYYLCLGVQQYLYESGRIDNIFCDPFYEKFTDCLNEVCRKFSLLYNESQYIVTRVEEEHLWESKQLGAHSPLVLLNTLMFFNTKHFSLTTVDEHLQLSFSHIMKHWKRNPNQPGARNVLLRFYPPQTGEGPRKKKVYEQQENEDNPLRCPVKLYEFYLSKCPESVKTRNDVFYLQPERSCVPDSPVWYSTMALGKEPLEKMLNRVKMVKEINVALLTS